MQIAPELKERRIVKCEMKLLETGRKWLILDSSMNLQIPGSWIKGIIRREAEERQYLIIDNQKFVKCAVGQKFDFRALKHGNSYKEFWDEREKKWKEPAKYIPPFANIKRTYTYSRKYKRHYGTFCGNLRQERQINNEKQKLEIICDVCKIFGCAGGFYSYASKAKFSNGFMNNVNFTFSIVFDISNEEDTRLYNRLIEVLKAFENGNTILEKEILPRHRLNRTLGFSLKVVEEKTIKPEDYLGGEI